MPVGWILSQWQMTPEFVMGRLIAVINEGVCDGKTDCWYKMRLVCDGNSDC